MHRVLALGLGGLLLAGCTASGTGQSRVLDAGQAAVSDDFDIAQSAVTESVEAVLAATGQPPGQPPAGLATATVQRLVQGAVIAGFAAGNGVAVTTTQVEAGVAELADQNGGMAALTELAQQSGIPADAIGDTVRTNLLVAGIGAKLDPTGDSTSQLEATGIALAEFSEATNVAVAPRYGSWDDAQLGISTGSSVVEPPVEQPAEQGAP
ncbi:MAG: hypothetical protein WCF36_16300 [Candidatus Nanopelagicales bacterium]